MKTLPKLEELLDTENFRIRTAMYLGQKSISTLNSFLTGVSYTIDAYGIKSKWPLEGFSEWVSSYYNQTYSTAGWKNTILKKCDGDEKQSIDEFFKLYDLFRNKKEISEQTS